MPAYYIDLFTPETWREIAAAEHEVSGFRASRRKQAEKIEPGDLLLCYLTGKSRFVGVLKTTSNSYFAEEPRIWNSDSFPVRFETELVVKVPEDRGIHLHEVVEQSAHARSWSGYYRGSPTRLPDDDGAYIVRRLNEVAAEHGADEPSVEIEVGAEEPEDAEAARPHTRIQHRLLKLGRDMRYEVWVARNDHDLRHCFGSAAITTLDPYKVQSYMGHQHYSTTQRYLHHKPRREDAAALAEAFRMPNRGTVRQTVERPA